MATITAKGRNKPPKTLRNVPEREVNLKCAELEDLGYTRIDVDYPEFSPSVKMSQVCALVDQVIANPDYNLDLYGFDVIAVVQAATREQVPAYYNEFDVNNFELELRSRLESMLEVT